MTFVDTADEFTPSAPDDGAPRKKPGPKPKAPADTVKSIDNPDPNARRVRVKFFNTEGDVGKAPIDIAVNGYPFRIEREAVVEVPEWLLPTVNNCVSEVMDPETGEMRAVMRFPYQILGDA